jgi:hypothetical protein
LIVACLFGGSLQRIALCAARFVVTVTDTVSRWNNGYAVRRAFTG